MAGRQGTKLQVRSKVSSRLCELLVIAQPK